MLLVLGVFRFEGLDSDEQACYRCYVDSLNHSIDRVLAQCPVSDRLISIACAKQLLFVLCVVTAS